MPLPADSAGPRLGPHRSAAVSAAVAAARADGRCASGRARPVCPGLGPASPASSTGPPPRSPGCAPGSRTPRRPSSLPGPRDSWHDADLVAPRAVALFPFAPDAWPGASLTLSWREAGALFLEARRRGLLSSARGAPPSTSCRRHSGSDSSRPTSRMTWPLSRRGRLRREAEALLATLLARPGSERVVVPDPVRARAQPLRVVLDPGLGGPRQRRSALRQGAPHRAGPPAARRCACARRERRSRRPASGGAVSSARDAARAVPGPGARAPPRGAGRRQSGPRHYLTTPRAHRPRRPRREREPPPHVRLRAARGPVAPRARRAGRPRRSCATPRAARVPTTCARPPRWPPSSATRRAEALVDVHVTRRKHVRPAAAAPAASGRPLRHPAGRAARPRGTPAAALGGEL